MQNIHNIFIYPHSGIKVCHNLMGSVYDQVSKTAINCLFKPFNAGIKSTHATLPDEIFTGDFPS
jgi:hypothetical protein